ASFIPRMRQPVSSPGCGSQFHPPDADALCRGVGCPHHPPFFLRRRRRRTFRLEFDEVLVPGKLFHYHQDITKQFI
ncbi:MAG TPA: hypothetical protein VF458_20635, partial [Ktedonobacteraceae bacterium]